jgi:hypothetical protein
MMITFGCLLRASSTPISAVGAVTSSIPTKTSSRSRMNVTFAGLSST